MDEIDFGKKTDDFKPLDEVAYVPDQAKEYGMKHKDVERGIVSSLNDKFVFVRFYNNMQYLGWKETTGKACNPNDLTKLDGFFKLED